MAREYPFFLLSVCVCVQNPVPLAYSCRRPVNAKNVSAMKIVTNPSPLYRGSYKRDRLIYDFVTDTSNPNGFDYKNCIIMTRKKREKNVKMRGASCFQLKRDVANKLEKNEKVKKVE